MIVHTIQPLVLYGHHGIISALALSTSESSHPSDPTLLCSASDDSPRLWNLEQCYQQYIAGIYTGSLKALGVLLKWLHDVYFYNCTALMRINCCLLLHL